MAWIYGHLQHEGRLRLPGDRHRQAGRAGRLRRPARGDRPRRHLLHPGGDEGAEDRSPSEATAVVQGFGNVGSRRRARSCTSAASKIDRRRRPLRRDPQRRAASTSPALTQHVAAGKLLQRLPRRRSRSTRDELLTHALHGAGAGGAGAASSPADNAGKLQLPHPGRGRQRPDDAGGGRDPGAAATSSSSPTCCATPAA